MGRGEIAAARANLIEAGARAGGVVFQRGAHGADMGRHRPAAAADQPCAGVAGEPRVVGHQFRRAVVVDMAVDIFRDAGIGLGNDEMQFGDILLNGSRERLRKYLKS